MTFPRGEMYKTFHCEQDDGFYSTSFTYSLQNKIFLSGVKEMEERSFIRTSCKWWHGNGYFIDGVDEQPEYHTVVLRKTWEEEIKVAAKVGYFDIDS